jgi:hypothetical protein
MCSPICLPKDFVCLKIKDARRQHVDVQNAGSSGNLAERSSIDVQNAGSSGNLAERSSILSVIVPTDGTSAATEGKGDFGTSPIFGQHRTSRCSSIFLYIVSDAKHNRD